MKARGLLGEETDFYGKPRGHKGVDCFLPGGPTVKALVEKLIVANRVFTAGPILYELLQGRKSSLERKRVKEALLCTRYLDITRDDWEGAAALAAELRKEGAALPMADILIAHLARQKDLEVIFFDAHFDRIPGLIHRRLQN